MRQLKKSGMKSKSRKALTALNQAKDDLRADKTELQHKLPELDQRGITEGKTSKHHCL